METKSPTTSVKSREMIGVDQFTQRREVFGKHDTVFLPLSPPNGTMPVYKEAEPIVTSNHAKTTSNFNRNTPAHSSMRESREDYNLEFRSRKYSDNFPSELNQSDEVDYRRSMTERTRRLSKLRREFLKSNLYEPSTESAFTRTGVRASMPASTAVKYKIESPNLYKFPFAEPYSTPPPVRRITVDLGPAEINGEKENHDPEAKAKITRQSLPGQDLSPKIDHQKLFEELVKRYSPQRKPVDWNLPPTKPRVVASVPKSTSSMADSVDSGERKASEDHLNKSGDDDVFLKKDNTTGPAKSSQKLNEKMTDTDIVTEKVDKINESKPSLSELEENKDKVPEMLPIPKPTEGEKRPAMEKFVDMTIPDLLEKMTEEAEELESHSHKKATKKVKRKRSFLDKLLGRKKEK